MTFALKDTRVRAEIHGIMAEVEVEQVFENPSATLELAEGGSPA